jgi:hypothetical protein
MSKVAKTIYLPRKGSYQEEISLIEQLKMLLRQAIYPHQTDNPSKQVTIIIEVIES